MMLFANDRQRWRSNLICFMSLIAVVTVARTTCAQNKFDTRMVPSDAMAVVAVYPNEILALPEMKLMPVEIARAWSIENIGIDVADVDSMVASSGKPSQAEMNFGVVVHLKKDFDTRLLSQKLFARQPELIDGYRVFPIKNSPDLYLYQVDSKTLVAATQSYLIKMLAADGKQGALNELLNSRPRTSPMAMAMIMAPIREEANEAARQMPADVPGPLQDLVELPHLVRGVVAEMNMGGESAYRLTIYGESDSDTIKVENIVTNAMFFGRDLAVMQAMQGVQGNDAIAEATRNYIRRLAEEITGLLQPVRNGSQLVLELDNQGGVASTGILVGLLLPAVQAAREAARRMSSTNNLRQIMLAFHNYHDVQGGFPAAAITDEEGNPLLSWRVTILPFIEQNELYSEFHLDEPWDSEHNIKLLDRMPMIYQDPSANIAPNLTVYQAIVGEDFLLSEIEKTPLSMVTDGTSNTIAVVESNVAVAVPWTKPGDVEIDSQNPLANMGSHHPGGFNAGIADGSVRFISLAIDPVVFWQLLTKAGGEVVNY